jgi:long-chain acyl-CoA synthetase
VRAKHAVEQASELLRSEIAEIGKTLPSYKKISDFVVVYDSLPRTTTKKLKKEELKKIYMALKGSPGAASLISQQELSYLELATMKTGNYKKVVDCILQVSPQIDVSKISVRSRIEVDLFLDSIKRIDLVCLLEEKFGITITDEAFEKARTLGDVVGLIQDIKTHEKIL